ncbi:MAG: dienelactone hydrolase family protein [Dermatophilaceae bacterium]
MTEQPPAQNVRFASNGHAASGYLAVPDAGSGPGVIVIQEWWGLDSHIVSVADRLAAQGFVALAPDLYGGRVVHGREDAAAMMAALPVDRAARDLSGAVDYLLDLDATTSEQVGVVGFCMGGGFVLLLAAQQGERVGAAAPFYGVGPGLPDTYTGLTAAVQGHYGLRDPSCPPEQVTVLQEQIRRESGADVEFFTYDAGHAFFNEENRTGNYDADLAALAWGRLVAFFRERLPSRSS